MPVAKPSWLGPVGPHLSSPDWLWAWQGLRAVYLFEGNDLFVADHGPSRAHGTIALPSTFTYANTPFGRALKVTGSASSGNYVEIASSPAVELTGTQLSIEAFLSFDTVGGFFRVFIDKSVDNAESYRMMLTNGDRIRFRLPNASPSNLDSNFTVTSGDFYHIVGTYDGATMRMYVNGDLHKSQAATGTVVASGDPLRFGIDASNVNSWYDGRLAKIALYNRALSAQEIKLLHADPFGAFRPDLWGPELAVGGPVSGGSTANIDVDTTGAGTKHASGGSTSSINVDATGAGSKTVTSGAQANLTVDALGQGTKTAQGGSEATVTVTTTGGGQAVTGGQGGSVASITVATSGAGTKHASGGAEANITIDASGDGTKHGFGGSEADIEVDATGGGATGGAIPPSVTVSGSLGPVTVSGSIDTASVPGRI